MAGRRSKLTPELAEMIAAALRHGASRTGAAAAAGISVSTFMAWLAKGRDSKSGAYRHLTELVDISEGQAQAQAAQNIFEASKRDWRAAAWWLDRRHRDDWALRISREAIDEQLRFECERLAEEFPDVNAEEAFKEAKRFIDAATAAR